MLRCNAYDSGARRVSLVAAVVVSLGVVFFLLKSRYNYLRLPELPVCAVEQSEDLDVTVVIPARNEAANIARAVKSFPGVRVIVVDDDSTDETAELARAAGANVIAAPRLHRGEVGKPNACAAGAKAATSRWILFVDADTWYEPDFLRSIVRCAREQSLDMVSAFLKQRCFTWWERILLPYSLALFFTGVSTRDVNSLKKLGSLANGQCLLFRRHAYEFVGGHRLAIKSLIEDAALANAAKRHRLKCCTMRAEKLGSARTYAGWLAIWRGLEKNSFRFLSLDAWCGVQVLLASILLASYLPIAAWMLSEGYGWPYITPFLLLPVILLGVWYAGLAVLLAPVAIYMFQLIALNALVSLTFDRRVIWKDRRI